MRETNQPKIELQHHLREISRLEFNRSEINNGIRSAKMKAEEAYIQHGVQTISTILNDANERNESLALTLALQDFAQKIKDLHH